MALAISDLGKPAIPLIGARVRKPIAVTTDTSYAAGGYAISAAALGLSSITSITLGVSSGFVPEWDAANGKLKVLYGNYDAADGPLIEVADGLDGITDVVFRGWVDGVSL